MDVNYFLDRIDDRIERYGASDKRLIGTCYVNAYEITQGYGGPEEGGWWYTIQTPIASLQVTTKKEANKAYHYLVENYADEYRDTHDYYSAAGDGCDFVIYLEDEYGHFEPSETPRYE
jgi:hypothetical protein